jgi:hypothetical protein
MCASIVVHLCCGINCQSYFVLYWHMYPCPKHHTILRDVLFGAMCKTSLSEVKHCNFYLCVIGLSQFDTSHPQELIL